MHERPEASEFCAQFAAELRVSGKIHKDDFIFHFLATHPSFANLSEAVRAYFHDGRRSSDLVRQLLYEELGFDADAQATMLEFASGYGCVTRHLPKVLPRISVTACDIHPQAVDFLRCELSSDAMLSNSIPEQFQARRKYDVVFALSFFSHMPKSTWARWLRVLYEHVEYGGFLIFTTHGLASLKYFPVKEIPRRGFLFVPISEQGDLDTAEYGSSLVTPEYVTKTVRRRFGTPIALFREAYWWAHQDLYVIAKRGTGLPARPKGLIGWAKQLSGRALRRADQGLNRAARSPAASWRRP